MNSDFTRSILLAFSKIGPVEYKIMNDSVDIYKDNIIIARVKDNYLYAINDKNQLTRVTHAHKKLCKKATDKILFAYNSNRKIRQM